MLTKLFDYQEDAVRRVEAALAGPGSRCVLSMACGSGKTLTAAALMERHAARGGSALFLVDRMALLWQSRRVFEQEGLDYGLLHERPEPRNPGGSVLLTTHQTLDSRIKANGGLPDYAAGRDLLVIDEVHLVFDSTLAVARGVVERGGRVLGLTATPTGRGVHQGKAFDTLVEGPTAAALVDAGRLVEPEHAVILAGLQPEDELELDEDMEDRGAFDWDENEVARVMGHDSRIDRIADEWIERLKHLPEPPRTLIFGATKDHSNAQMLACAKRMREVWGPKWQARLFVDDTPKKVREDAIRDFADRPIRILASVRALAVGFDEPAAEVLLDCRPAKRSWNAWQQGYGRICRAAAGKSGAIYMDASANLIRFGDFAKHVKGHGYRKLPTQTVRGKSRKSWKCRGRLDCETCGHVRGVQYSERNEAKSKGWAPPCGPCFKKQESSCMTLTKCDAENPLSAFDCGTCGAPRPGFPPKVCDVCGWKTFHSAVVCAKCGYIYPGEEARCPEHDIPLQEVRELVDGKLKTVKQACVYPDCEFNDEQDATLAADGAAAEAELEEEARAEEDEPVKPWKVEYDGGQEWGVASERHRKKGETVRVRSRYGSEWNEVIVGRAKAVWKCRGYVCYATRAVA